LEANRLRIVGNFDGFGMPGLSGTDDFVMGGRCRAAGVSGDRAVDAAQLFEDQLHPPKATAGQDDRLGCRRATRGESRSEGCGERESQGKEALHILYNALAVPLVFPLRFS